MRAAFSHTRIIVSAALALCLVLCGTPLLIRGGALSANADTVEEAKEATEAANAAVDEAETELKRTADSYNAAVAEQDRLESEIGSLDKKIKKIEKLLPQEQERSDESCVALYKFTLDSLGVLDVLLSAQTITEALSLLDSYNYIIDQNVAQMNKTMQLKEDLEQSHKQLESDKTNADSAARAAESAYEDALSAREAAKQKALEAQAAEKEAAAEATKQAKKEATTKQEKTAVTKSASKESSSASHASASNVDWSGDEKAFVNKWAPRINSYLSGSALAGTGQTFAAAAWENGVDPRWAPAISCVESGKGAACFRSYNAWGYGGMDFSSWEEGIQTVVAGLGSSTYGGYLTKAAAQTYCPPTWQDWYNECAAEMAKI